MTGRIPARSHAWMASRTPGLTGSLNATRPTQVKSSYVASAPDESCLNASASTRIPLAAMRPFAARISALEARVSGWTASPSSHEVESARTSSGAPLTATSRSVALSL